MRLPKDDGRFPTTARNGPTTVGGQRRGPRVGVATCTVERRAHASTCVAISFRRVGTARKSARLCPPYGVAKARSLLEEFQVRRGLALLGRHQVAVLAHEVILLADQHMMIAVAAGSLEP